MKSAATVLTASARLARVLRADYDATQQADGQIAWVSPDIYHLPQWLHERWLDSVYGHAGDFHPLLLNAAQEGVLWERVISESVHKDELLHVPATAETALKAWNLLHAWRLDPSGSDWDSSKDTDAFRGWSLKYRELCESNGWLSGALLPDFLAERFDQNQLPAPSRLCLAGFDELEPQQDRLFDALRRAGCEIESVVPAKGVNRGPCTRLGLADAEREMMSAAKWARMLLDRGTNGTIGVVVPDLEKVRTRLETIFDDVLHPGTALTGPSGRQRAFNISLGLPLLEYPVIHAAFRVLDLSDSLVPLLDVAALLRSPFIAGAEAEQTRRAMLDAQLRRRHMLQVSLNHVASLARGRADDEADQPHRCPIFGERLQRFLVERKRIPSRQRPSDWVSGFSRLLEVLGWPGEHTLDTVEYQAFAKWRELLSSFASLDLGTGAISFDEARRLLRQMGSGSQFQPKSEEAPVQILGILETSGLRFDQLWVMGLHDGVWPRPARPNPFLPLALQRQHNLPHSSAVREAQFARQITDRLLASAGQVVVSHPTREGDCDLRPSPLILDVPEVHADELGLPSFPTYVDRLCGSADLETLEDSNAPPVEGKSWQRGGASVFREQAACPFRAFALLRVGADPLEEVQAGLSPPERGILLHRVLELVWDSLGSQENLLSRSSDELEELVGDSVKQVLDDAAGTMQLLKRLRFRSIEQDRLKRLVLEWLEVEKKRAPFTVLQQERGQEVRLGELDLRIRLDRVDRLNDGRHLLIDYKSGEHRPSQWEGDRPEEPQLPLYAVATGLDLAGVAFAQLKPGQLRFAGLASGEDVAPGLKDLDGDWDELLERWRRTLETLAADFLKGRAPVDPKRRPDTCKYCGLTGFCRISEATPAEGDAAEGGTDE